MSQRIKQLQGSIQSTEIDEGNLLLKKNLDKGLQELGISDWGCLPQEIQQVKIFIEEAQSDIVNDLKQHLLRLEDLHKLAEQIYGAKESADIQLQIDSQSHGEDQEQSQYDQVKQAFEDAQQMPACVERSLKIIIFQLKQLQDIPILEEMNQEQQSMLDIINQEVIQLKQSLAIEEIIKRFVKDDFIDLFVQKIKIKQWDEAKIFLNDSLLRKLQVLQIEELIRLTQKTDEAAKLIRDQDVILFLGETRDGKSTTTHYLAGSKMKKTQINEIDTIIAEKVTNSYLQKIIISEKTKSQTRFLSPVLVNFKDVPGTKNLDWSIWLCDSPGFNDNNGPEVDIANGIGIF